MDQLTRTTDTTGTTKAQQIGQAKHSGGAAVAERPATFQDAKLYAAQCRQILTDKGQTAGFDIGTTAVGALLLSQEALLSALQQQGATAWDGNATVGGKT